MPALPSPREAWTRLIQAAETGQQPEMDAATAAGLAAIGGWEQFQYTEYRELEFLFKEFKAVYESAVDKSATLALSGGSTKRLEGSNG
jgi:hypothetical protein